MNRAKGAPGCEQHNQPLNLPPAAKANGIAQIAAALRQCRRLKTGIIAEAQDKVGRSINCAAIMEIGDGRGSLIRVIKSGKRHGQANNKQSWRDDYGQW